MLSPVRAPTLAIAILTTTECHREAHVAGDVDTRCHWQRQVSTLDDSECLPNIDYRWT